MQKDRIKKRLTALRITQFAAGDRMGSKSYIYRLLNGTTHKPPDEIRAVKIAQALECSLEYLYGTSEVIGMPPEPGTAVTLPTTDDFFATSSDEDVGKSLKAPKPSKSKRQSPSTDDDSRLTPQSVPVVGIVETGVFRKMEAISAPANTPKIPANPGHPATSQRAYLMAGPGLTERGITDGMYLICVPTGGVNELTNGSVVIVEHSRMSGREVEISAREIQHYPDRTEYVARSHSKGLEPIVVRDGSTEEPDGRVTVRGLVIAASLFF